MILVCSLLIRGEIDLDKRLTLVCSSVAGNKVTVPGTTDTRQIFVSVLEM